MYPAVALTCIIEIICVPVCAFVFYWQFGGSIDDVREYYRRVKAANGGTPEPVQVKVDAGVFKTVSAKQYYLYRDHSLGRFVRSVLYLAVATVAQLVLIAPPLSYWMLGILYGVIGLSFLLSWLDDKILCNHDGWAAFWIWIFVILLSAAAAIALPILTSDGVVMSELKSYSESKMYYAASAYLAEDADGKYVTLDSDGYHYEIFTSAEAPESELYHIMAREREPDSTEVIFRPIEANNAYAYENSYAYLELYTTYEEKYSPLFKADEIFRSDPYKYPNRTLVIHVNEDQIAINYDDGASGVPLEYLPSGVPYVAEKTD